VAFIAQDCRAPRLESQASTATKQYACPCCNFPDKIAHCYADNEGIRAKVKADLGADAGAVDFLPFTDLERSVQDDIKVLKDSPIMDPAVPVHGYIYDVSLWPNHSP